ncbi:hypothetical protein L7F22_031278 [Adiantum nelumboides]|nr:hypothetical protein [Adiantum nelumboides]
MAHYYSDLKDNIGADVKEPVDASSGKQESQTLSGPRESPSSGSIDRPWSGRLCTQVTPQSAPQISCKGKEKVDQMLDEEFGIPAVKSPGVAKEIARTPSSDLGQRRSNRVRFPMDRTERQHAIETDYDLNEDHTASKSVGDIGLEAVALSCKDLEELRVFPSIDDEGLLQSSASKEGLVAISIGDSGLEAVALSCKDLEELRVFPSIDNEGLLQSSPSEEGLVAISAGCRKLQSILHDE